MNMHKNDKRKPLRLRAGTCLLLQCGLLPIYAAVFSVCYVATDAPLHPARAAELAAVLESALAALVLLTFGALVGELLCRDR